VAQVNVSGIDVSGIAVNHKFIVLSGTADIKVNGVPLIVGSNQSVNLSLYDTHEGNGNQIGYANVNSEGAWSMSLNSPPASGTYYFRVYAYNSTQGQSFNKSNVQDITFPIATYSGISIVHDFQATILSGTANITVNGSPASNVQVSASARSGSSSSGLGYAQASNGNWAISTTEPIVPGPIIEFYVSYNVSGNHYSYDADPITYTSSSAPINLDKSFITLSGSITLSAGGTPVSEYTLAAMDSAGKILGETWSESSSSNWTIPIESVSGTVTFNARLTLYDSGKDYGFVAGVGTTNVSGTATSGINLSANVAVKNLSVSIRSGGTPVDAFFAMLPNQFDPGSSYYGWDDIIMQTGDTMANWNIKIPNATPNNIWFVVGIRDASDNWTYYRTTSSVNISSGSVTLDINNLQFVDY
jgi:hypothetical protein